MQIKCILVPNHLSIVSSSSFHFLTSFCFWCAAYGKSGLWSPHHPVSPSMLFAVRRSLSAEALAKAGVVGRALSAEALAEAGVVNIRLRGYTSLHSHYLHCHCDPAKREWQSFFLPQCLILHFPFIPAEAGFRFDFLLFC